MKWDHHTRIMTYVKINEGAQNKLNFTSYKVKYALLRIAVSITSRSAHEDFIILFYAVKFKHAS